MPSQNDRMKVALMEAPGTISLVEREIPSVSPGHALVRVNYVGVCGSDSALFENGYIGESVVESPMVLGHEASGTVVAVGDGVTHLVPGDRVAMEPGIPCMDCEYCRSGTYNLCPSVYFWASLPVVEGALQEYVSHPAAFCFKLPDSVSLLSGALIEPLSVAFHAVTSSRASLGSSAVVLGAGCIGILTMLTLKAAGVRDVLVVDLVDNRLDLAARLGAEVINASRTNDVAAEIRARFGDGPDLTFETAGNAVTMDQAIRIAKPGSVVVFVGYTKNGRADLNVNLLIDKELTIKTVFRYRNVHRKAIAAVASGALPVEEVVSAIFPFEQTQRGMEEAIHNKGAVTKCVIEVAPEER